MRLAFFLASAGQMQCSSTSGSSLDETWALGGCTHSLLSCFFSPLLASFLLALPDKHQCLAPRRAWFLSPFLPISLPSLPASPPGKDSRSLTPPTVLLHLRSFGDWKHYQRMTNRSIGAVFPALFCCVYGYNPPAPFFRIEYLVAHQDRRIACR